VHRASLLCALLLACTRPVEQAAPPAPPVEPPPAVDPCVSAPVPEDSAEALARADLLLRCGDDVGALEVKFALLRRDPTSTARAYALAVLAHESGRVGEIDRMVAGLPLTAGTRAVYRLTRDVSAYLDAVAQVSGETGKRGDPALDGAGLARDVAATLAVTADDPYALSLALRFTATHDADPRERAAPICRDRADPLLSRLRDHEGAAVLAAACGRIAFLSGEPVDGRRRFARALELAPDDAAAALAWAAAELAAGNLGEAVRLYERAVVAPSPRLRYAAFLGLGVAQARRHERAAAEAAYRSAAAVRGLDLSAPEQLPPELLFNLGALLADGSDQAARAEARVLLRAYVAGPAADERRRMRARILLRELGD
jgi:tetratricopeptide (TPR) repeat protein